MRKRAGFVRNHEECMCVCLVNVSSFVSLSLIRGHCAWHKRTHSKMSIQFTSLTHKHTFFIKNRRGLFQRHAHNRNSSKWDLYLVLTKPRTNSSPYLPSMCVCWQEDLERKAHVPKVTQLSLTIISYGVLQRYFTYIFIWQPEHIAQKRKNVCLCVYASIF